MACDNIHIMLFLLIIVLFALYAHLYLTIFSENFTPISNDALQNLASLYNNGTLTVSNLKVTQNASIGGNLTTAGNSTVSGNSTVAGSSTLANWNINNNRLGI